MKKPYRLLLIFPILMLVVGLACSLSSGASFTPVPTKLVARTATRVSQPTQARTPEEIVKIQPTSGNVTIQITDAQATDYVRSELSGRTEFNLQNPAIAFQTDQVILTGTVQGGFISADGRVVGTVSVDSQGKPHVQIIEANFGIIPIPAGMLTSLTTMIDDALLKMTGQYGKNYQLQSITFSPGLATMVLARK